MNKTLKKALIITFFMICIFALTVVGASAAETTGYENDAAALVADSTFVARIGDEGTSAVYYNTVETAIAAATSQSNVVTVIQNCTLATKVDALPCNVVLTSKDTTSITVTLGLANWYDLLGNTVSSKVWLTLENIKIDCGSKNLCWLNGDRLDINTGAELYGAGAGSTYGMLYLVNTNSAQLNINGGTINVTGSGYGIVVTGNSTVTMNSGLIKKDSASGNLFYADSSDAVLNLLGGNLEINYASSTAEIVKVNAVKKIVLGGTIVNAGTGNVVYYQGTTPGMLEIREGFTSNKMGFPGKVPVYANDYTASVLGYVARIGEPADWATGYAASNYHKTLAAAVSAAGTSGTVYVFADCSSGAITTADGCDITITGVAKGDGTYPTVTDTAGSTNMIDLAAGKTVLITNLNLSSPQAIFWISGKLTLGTGAKITATTTNDLIRVGSSGVFVVDGGIIEMSGAGDGIQVDGTMYVLSGTLSDADGLIIYNNQGTVVITGGTVKGNYAQSGGATNTNIIGTAADISGFTGIVNHLTVFMDSDATALHYGYYVRVGELSKTVTLVDGTSTATVGNYATTMTTGIGLAPASTATTLYVLGNHTADSLTFSDRNVVIKSVGNTVFTVTSSGVGAANLLYLNSNNTLVLQDITLSITQYGIRAQGTDCTNNHVTLKSGATIEKTNTTTGTWLLSVETTASSVTIEDGAKIKATDAAQSIVLVQVTKTDATLTITGGTFENASTGYIVNTSCVTNISGGLFVHSGTGSILYYNSATAAKVKVTGTTTMIHEGSGTGDIFRRNGGALIVDGVDVKLIARGNNFIFENGYQNNIAGFNDSDDLIVKGAYLFTERSDKTFIRDDVDASYINFSNVSLDSDAVAKLMRGDEDLDGTKIVYYFKCRLYTAETKQITIPAYGENEAQTITVYVGYANDYAKAIASAPTDGTQATLTFLDNVTSIARIGGTKIVAGQNIVIQGGSYNINGSNATYFLSVEAGASLTLSGVAFTGCPTQFANVAGTLHFQSGASLTCTANGSTSETTPIINLSGAATLTIDQGAGIYTVYPDGERVEGEPSYIKNPHVINMETTYTGTITVGGTISHKWDTTGDWGPIFRVRGDAKIVLLSTAVLEFDTTAAAAGGNALFLDGDSGKATLTVAANAQIRSTTYPIFSGDGIFFDSDESAFNFNPNYTARIGDDLLCTSYYESYVQAIAAVPASGTATIYLLVDVTGVHDDLAYSFTIDSQTITLSGVLKGDGTYTSLTTTGASTKELFKFATNNVETYLTFANINITVSGRFLFGDCPGSTLTLDAGTVLKTAQTLGGDYLIKCYDWAVITLNEGAKIDTTGSTVTGDYQLINFYSTGGSGTTNANAAVNINGEIIFKLTGPEATSQLKVFSMTDGFAGTITIGETADITYAPTNAKASTSGVFVAYANIEINGGNITMGVYDAEGPDTATVGYLIFFDSTVKTVNINGGTFINYTNSNMYNGGGANLNIKGGSFTASGGNILNVTGGTVAISGGTLTQTGAGRVIYNESAGTVNISGGTLAHSGSQVIMDSYGTLNISVGKFEYTGTFQMLKLRGTTTITGGTFTNTAKAGSNTMIESSGTTTISGTASFECASTGLMFNVWGGSLTVNGGSFKTATASAIISNSYPVTIAGGRFEHSGAGNILTAGSGEITNVSATESLVVFKHTGSGMIFNNPSKQWIHVDGGASSNVQIIAEGTSQVFYDGYCATAANAYIYVAETAAYVSADANDYKHISYQNVMFDDNTVAAKMYAYLQVGNGTATITVEGQQRTVYTGYYGFQYDTDEAIAAAIDGGKTLYLIKTPDQNLARGITVAAGKTLTVDGNGFTQSVASDATFAFVVEGSLTLQNITLNANGLFASVTGGTLVIGDNATLQGTIHDPGSTYNGYIQMAGDASTVTVNASAVINAQASSAGKEIYVIQASAATNAVITHRGTINVAAGATTSNIDVINFTGTCTGSTVYIYGSIVNHMTNAKNHRLVDANAGTNVYVYEGATLTEDGTGNTENGALILSSGTVTISGGSFVTKGAGHVLNISGTATITGGTMVHYGTGEVIRYSAKTAAVTVGGNTTLIHQGSGESFIIRRTGGAIKIDGDNVKLIARGENYIFRQGYCDTVAGVSDAGRMTVKGAYLSTERDDKSICYGEVSWIDFIGVKADSREAAAAMIGYTADPNKDAAGTGPVSLLFIQLSGTATISIPATEGREAVNNAEIATGFYSKLSEVWATVTTSGTHTITVVNDYTVVAGDVKTFDGAYTIVLQGVENGEGGYTKLTETISDLFLNIKRGTNLTTKNLHIVSDGSLVQVDAAGTNTYFILGEKTKLTTAATVRNGDLFLLYNTGYITVTQTAVIDTTGSNVSGRLEMFRTYGKAYSGEIRVEGTIIHALACTGDSKIFRFSSLTGTVTVTSTAVITYSCTSDLVSAENAIFHAYLQGSEFTIWDNINHVYNIEGGTITHSSASGSVYYGCGFGPATLNLKGGTVNITGGGNLAHLTYGSELRVTGGTVNVSGSYLISGDRSGAAYVSGGTINLTDGAVMMKSPEVLYITGGTFTADANSKGATSAANTVGVSIKGIAITDDAMASRLLANFRADGKYYTSLADALATGETTIYVVGNGLRKVDRTAGGFTVATGTKLTLAGVDGLGVMNVNGMNDTYLFVVNGELVLENVTLTNCPTKLANVSGTLTMNGVTAELFSKRDNEAAVHETSPFIYLQGAGVATLDADTEVRFTYADDDDTHDAVDHQASIYVFHTASDWTGTLTIAGTVEMGWNVRGYSAIFYLESTAGTILIKSTADVQHTATEGASDNALLVSPVKEGNESGNNPNATTVNVEAEAVVQILYGSIRDGHINAVSSAAKAVFEYEGDTISVIITWEDAIHFTYDRGTWDPENLTYVGGGWKPTTTNSNIVTIQNAGDIAVDASFAYGKNSGYEDISGSFTADGMSNNTIALPVGGEACAVTLTLSGDEPDAAIDNQTIGVITITIAVSE